MTDPTENIKEQVEARVAAEAADQKPDADGGLSSKFIQKCYWANELGDGVLFNVLHRGKFIFCKSIETWLIWDDHHWSLDVFDSARASVENVVAAYQEEIDRINDDIKPLLGNPDEKSRVKRMETLRNGFLSRISALRTMRRRENCLKAAHTCDDPLAIQGEELDQKPWLLPCKNGVVDLKTGEIAPGRPGDYLLKSCPTEYIGIDAPRETWEKALNDIFEDDELMVSYIQRLFGMAIVGAVFEHVFPVLTGPGGRNGKSTIIETIAHVLGPLAAPIRAEMLLDTYQVQASSGPTPDIMSLRGRRIVWASETKDGAKISEAKVKWLTGGDRLTGRNPHDKYDVTFAPTHTLLMLSNFKPRADSNDKAFWERMQNIPFNVSFLKNREPTADNERRADLFLRDKLMAEASGILGWLVEGCLMWQLEGLNPPPKVVRETQEYLEDEDNLGAFIEYCLDLDPAYTIGATELHEAFEVWWKKYVSNFPPKQKTFGKQMKKRFDRQKTGGVYVYNGCTLNHEWYEIMESKRK